MKAFGRLLQILGLTVMPLSMVMELTGGIGVREMLAAMIFGITAFCLGRVLEGYASESPRHR